MTLVFKTPRGKTYRHTDKWRQNTPPPTLPSTWVMISHSGPVAGRTDSMSLRGSLVEAERNKLSGWQRKSCRSDAVPRAQKARSQPSRLLTVLLLVVCRRIRFASAVFEDMTDRLASTRVVCRPSVHEFLRDSMMPRDYGCRLL